MNSTLLHCLFEFRRLDNSFLTNLSTNKQHLELSHKKIIFASDYYKGKINETNKLIRVSTRKHRYIDGY